MNTTDVYSVHDCLCRYRHNVEAEAHCYVVQCIGEWLVINDVVDCMHAADEGLCGRNVLHLIYHYHAVVSCS